MSGPERRSQVLGIAAGEFANHGLHGASIAAIAHEAGITQAYAFRMFGTKKALFVELVGAAFDRSATACRRPPRAREALARFRRRRRMLADTDPDVRESAARQWCAWEDAHVSLAPQATDRTRASARTS